MYYLNILIYFNLLSEKNDNDKDYVRRINMPKMYIKI